MSDDKRVMFSRRLRESTIEKLKAEAARRGEDVTAIVEEKLEGPARIDEVISRLARIERLLLKRRRVRR